MILYLFVYLDKLIGFQYYTSVMTFRVF